MSKSWIDRGSIAAQIGAIAPVSGEFLRVPESLCILKSDKREKSTRRVAFLFFVHLLVNVAKLVGPGGSRGLLAETLLIKHQLIVLNRSCRRAPNFTTSDWFLFGLTCSFMTPARMAKNTVVVSTATLFKYHQALVRRKYSRLFSSAHKKRMPGPKGPSQGLIDAIALMKRRNPRFGCPRIAQQINKALSSKVQEFDLHPHAEDLGSSG